jgi:excisionase family DNA binding protein
VTDDRRDPNRPDRRQLPLRRGGRRAVDQPSDTAWTVSQLAYYIGMSADFIERQIDVRKIKATRLGTAIRISTIEVFRYLDEQEFPRPSQEWMARRHLIPSNGARAIDQPSETAWSPTQVAYYIGMSADFVRSEIRAGDIKASMFGREWRIATVEVIKYLDARQFPPPTEREAAERE